MISTTPRFDAPKDPPVPAAKNAGKPCALTDRPFLSVIIPAFNEEARLPATLKAFEELQQTTSVEIILVCDGCTDHTDAVAAEWKNRLPIHILTYPINRGKGYAVRQGVRQASGQIIAFVDADGATPPMELLRLSEPIASGSVDMVIGSRRAAGNRIKKQPLFRQILGKILSVTTQTLLDLPIQDTQCGFKLFRHKQAKMLFDRIHSDGFEFDLELLSLARQLNIPMLEMGIAWQDQPGSKVAPVRDGLRMLRTIYEIRQLHRPQTAAKRPFASRRTIHDIPGK